MWEVVPGLSSCRPVGAENSINRYDYSLKARKFSTRWSPYVRQAVSRADREGSLPSLLR